MNWSGPVRGYRKVGWFIFLISGPLMLLAGLGCAVHTLIFLHHAIRVEGKVFDLQHDQDRAHELTAPIFRFVAGDGRTYTVESNNFSDPPEFNIGQSVGVLYSPVAPANARIDTFWQVWGLESVLVPLGCFFVIVSGVRIWRWRRKSFRPLAA